MDSETEGQTIDYNIENVQLEDIAWGAIAWLGFRQPAIVPSWIKS